MKKWFIVTVAAIGIILAGFGISAKMKGAASIGIIGGADGPTAIFVAGKVSDGFSLGIIILGILLILLGILVYRKIKK